MEFRTIGPRGGDGMRVSVVGLGCNAFGRRIDERDSVTVVRAALDAGITFFDTAESYGDGRSEEWLDKGLGTRRKDVVIATKFGWGLQHVPGKGGGAPENVAIALEGSLRRLGSDWIDLYQLHRPDPTTPIADTLGALSDLVRAGKLRFVGCSNFSGAQLAEAAAVSEAKGFVSFVTAQNKWSVLDQDVEKDLLPTCRQFGIGVLPYYPLARGLLTGKYRRNMPPPAGSRLAVDPRSSRVLSGADFDRLEALEAFAGNCGHSLLDLAISWLAGRSETASVIAGASRPEQPAVNVAAAGWRMSDSERAEIDRIVAR
jgi:aryl-alcohol dehydrogenase-like predicted oxidoreductase